MYKVPQMHRTSLNVNESTQGETIEQRVERMTENREPITDGAPIIYQERADGVNPAYNIRTDRMELAVEAKDKETKGQLAKREKALKDLHEKNNPKATEKNENSAEPKP